MPRGNWVSFPFPARVALQCLLGLQSTKNHPLCPQEAPGPAPAGPPLGFLQERTGTVKHRQAYSPALQPLPRGLALIECHQMHCHSIITYIIFTFHFYNDTCKPSTDSRKCTLIAHLMTVSRTQHDLIMLTDCLASCAHCSMLIPQSETPMHSSSANTTRNNPFCVKRHAFARKLETRKCQPLSCDGCQQSPSALLQ